MSIVNIDPASGREILLFDAFGYNGQYEVQATGFAGVATKNTTTNLDFPIGAEDRYINGVHLFLKNHTWNDKILALQIVDVDGILPNPANPGNNFPPGTALKQFGLNWNVNDEAQDQGRNQFDYVSRTYAGLYIRLVYLATGTMLDVDVRLNCLMHKKVA